MQLFINNVIIPKLISKNHLSRFYILTGGLDTVTSPVPPVTSDTGTETHFHSTTNKEQSSTTKFKGMPRNDATLL